MEQIDLETIRGDDDGWLFEVADENGEAIDFTDCRLDLHIKPNGKNAQTVKLSTTTGEIGVVDNLITVILPHEKTTGVNWESAQWDIQLTDSEGLIRTLAGGEFTLTPDITEV